MPSNAPPTGVVQRVPISALPLPPRTQSLIHALTPDPYTPSPHVWREIRAEKPSLQRRARLLAPAAHFSYVAPCPLPFPYRVDYAKKPAAAPKEGVELDGKKAEEDDEEELDGEAQVRATEQWLVNREALREVPPAGGASATLQKYVADAREGERILIGLAESGLRDCLPALDVGDASTLLGTPSLSAPLGQDEDAPVPEVSEIVKAARQELIDVLSGHATLMKTGEDEVEAQWAPWSLRYSGHQFGTFAGQLGDGRAISLLATPHPDDADTVYELQLKGAGRTPFSRMADGLAVLRSSIREFLCSEAMHALGIPTTRSLALISLPKVPVERERMETACVLTRVAPSFVRIGSFEALNPPAQMFFMGGGQQRADLDALRVLGEWTARRVLRLPSIHWRGDEGVEGSGDAWGTKLILEVARRNARMVAGWQAYGFMHGVINTDNVSILGLTTDYGPYAFMDVFDPWHICNHTDAEGRYAYKYQPSSIVFALRALLDALAPLIGAEDELGGKAVSPGWATDASEDNIKAWTERGRDLVKPQLEHIATEDCAVEYSRLIHKRLGLRRTDETDEVTLARPLLDLMKDHKLDFHRTFRRLCAFRPASASAEADAFAASLLSLSLEDPGRLDAARAQSEFAAWLRTYAARVESEWDLWTGADVDAERRAEMEGANPRFVLRQWLLEEVIRKVDEDAERGKRVLGKVLQMACDPFAPWGREGVQDDSELSAEEKEERRYCGTGDARLLGFQCSCSS
ncbi:uncharacterized protein BXZ73DRAFT_96251 [Epithele typhae]|uniref:uncharacterized protein n=1 Tax=Epithele typhae TaxID=378194 RepID=UPI00200741BC|nr:uncharacterized protein BXZ73DRAFT_96251 [Epithele typhae]KAH9945264.1 hypothetical protein BXZ73DRAFT_96251 [Epithele typhae]